MKLTLLGTGPFQPDTPHASAGYVLEAENTMIKLDFGRGNLLRMAECGIDWRALDAICISHIHPDHITDLFQYLQAYTVVRELKQLEKTVALYGPAGFAEYMQKFVAIIEAPQHQMPQTQEVQQSQYMIGAIAVTTATLQHSVPNTGYRFDASGKGICYTGDTGVCDALIALASGADILLTESLAPTDAASETHLLPKDIATIVREAGVQKVVLTHYPGDPTVRAQIKKEIESACDAEVIAGEDKQVIEI